MPDEETTTGSENKSTESEALDHSGQPQEEMQEEIDDMIDFTPVTEDDEADAVIDDTSDEEDLSDESEDTEQTDEEGSEEGDGEEDSAEQESEETAEREDEETDDGEGEEEGEEVESDPDAEPTVKELQDQIKEMMKFFSSGIQPPAQQTPPVQETQEAQPEASPPAEQARPIIVDDILKDIDMDDLASDKEVFKKVIEDVIVQTTNATSQQILLAIPKIMTNQVQQQQTINTAINDFYRENNDLEAVKPTVGAVANQVQAQNPTWTMKEIFDETATRTRKMLGLRKRVVSQEKTPDKGTKTVRKSGLHTKKPGAGNRSSVSKDGRTKLQKEIDDIM